MMTTLPRSSRHKSHTSQLPVLEVKPLKKYTSINKLVVVSPELKLTTTRRPCGELRDNTNHASPQSERTDVTNKLYRTREDNSCVNNNNHDVGDKYNVGISIYTVGQGWANLGSLATCNSFAS